MKKILSFGVLLGFLGFSNAQLPGFNETFESFTTGNAATWPQNNWSKVASGSGPWVYADGTTDKYVQYYSFFTSNTAGYLISPQIVAPDGTQTLTYTIAKTSGSGGNGTIEVGLVTNTTDMTTFTAISPLYTLEVVGDNTYTITVPASSQQYIAFKIIGFAQHTALQVDDVILTESTLNVVNTSAKNGVQFALTDDQSALQFITTKELSKVQVYATTGQKVAEGTVRNNQFNVSTLKSGMYLILIETKNGQTIKSKFLKK